VLVDECVDARFSPHIAGFETQTVLAKGWSGISNGKLLALLEAIPTAQMGQVSHVGTPEGHSWIGPT
jgi:hypothetical protein